MCPTSSNESVGTDLITVDMGPHARGVFTTRVWAPDEAADVLGGPVTFAHQVHGAQVLGAHESSGSADAVLGIDRAVGVRVADCVPLLLAAPGMVAAVHAGRRGLLAGVVQAALAAMAHSGHRPTHAAIGPAICGRCYEVPAAMSAQAAAHDQVLQTRTRWGTPAIDLPAGVAAIVRRFGVRHLTRVPACTYEDERFFSYRRDGTASRFAGLIAPVGGDTPQ